MKYNFKNWLIGGLFNLFIMGILYLMLFLSKAELLVSMEQLVNFVIPIQIVYCFVIGGLGIFFMNILFFDEGEIKER